MKLEYKQSSDGSIRAPFQVDLLKDEHKLVGEVLVHFTLEFDERSWGVKDVVPTLNSMQFYVGKENSDDQHHYIYTSLLPEVVIDGPTSRRYEKDWKIEYKWTSRDCPGFGVDVVDIDVDFKKITITLYH